MTNIDIMLDYVKIISKYENMRYFVEHGKLFIGREPSENVIKGKIFEPKIKQCYDNAQRLLLYTNNLRYFEGYTIFQGVVIDHAWNVTSDDKVIDVTLEKVEEKYERGKEEDVYYGIEIPNEFVLVEMIKKGSTNSLMIDYVKSRTKA